MNFRHNLLATVLGLALVATPALAQETKYQQWPGSEGSPEVDKLVQQLEELIDQAEADRAADPQFIEDLRTVLSDYQNPWQARLLYDDFGDGEYAKNPTWTVSSGAYKVDRKGQFTGLRSTIIPPGQVSGQSSTGSAALDVLGALLNQQPTNTAEYAAIYTPVKISNVFAVRIEFASGERFGRFEFGPYQGQSGNVAYRLAYQPGAAKDSLKLIRVTAKGAVAIGTFKGKLNLEDQRRHVLEWTRDRNGAMTVALDGQDMITVTDKQIGKPFDGFLMLNSGGTYWVRSITVDGVKG